MRSHHYIREREQALGNGALQNTLGHILEYEISFFFINIQSYCKELMITDSGDQVLCLDQAAAGSVYKNYTIFHFGDSFFIDDVFGFFCKRAVKTDEITGCQKLIQRYIFQIIQALIREKIVSDNSHTKTFADFCHCLANFSGTNDSGSFLIEIKSHQTT